MEKTQTKHFRNLLRTFDTAVLITHGQQTHFSSRPMVIALVEDNCDLWFITNEDSAKVHEIEADTRCHVVCQNGRSSCATVSGHACIVRDRVTINELWKPGYRIWYPQGLNDPSIVLIQVTGEHGEYWDNTGAKGITYMYRAIRAVVTGTTPEVTEGEQHGHVDLVHRT
jgi:general stress protein 26